MPCRPTRRLSRAARLGTLPHALARVQPDERRGVRAGATLAYGEYLDAACKFYHGENLGGQKQGGEPGAPPSPPIGPNSVVAHWTDAPFIQTLRTGVTPEGRKLDGKSMPWQAVGTLGDDELRALLMALKKGP